jgi:hypothetical protein
VNYVYRLDPNDQEVRKLKAGALRKIVSSRRIGINAGLFGNGHIVHPVCFLPTAMPIFLTYEDWRNVHASVVSYFGVVGHFISDRLKVRPTSALTPQLAQ